MSRCIIRKTMSSIIKPNTFKTDNIKLSNVKKNAKGSNTVLFNYENSMGETINKVIIQTPKMPAPFGLSEFPTEYGVKYSLDASFRDKDDNVKINEFYEMLKKLDEFMILKAVENSKEWFGKKMSEEIVREFYRPIIKTGKQKKDSDECYPDTIKFKIRTTGEKKNVDAYDVDRNRVEIDELKKGSSFRALVDISPIWFVNKTFGFSMNLVQIEISKPDKIEGFSFEDDSDVEYDDDISND